MARIPFKTGFVSCVLFATWLVPLSTGAFPPTELERHVPRLPMAPNDAMETRIVRDFIFDFWHAPADADSIRALRKVWAYYQITGQQSKFSRVLDRVLQWPYSGCGTSIHRWANVALLYCKQLKKDNETELYGLCLPYAAPLTERPQYTDPEIKRLQTFAESGYFYYDGHVLRVGCGNDPCIREVSKFTRPLDIQDVYPKSITQWKLLKGMPNIQGFTFYRDNNEILDLLPTLTGLKKLSTSPALLCKLDTATLSRLQELTLGGTALTPQSAQIIGRMPNLRTLFISGATTEAALAALAKTTKIHDLSLLSCGLTGKQIRHVAGISTLQHLWISDKRLTELPDLNSLVNLEVLSLTDAPITDNDLRAVSRLKNLRKLRLSSTNVNGTGLTQLRSPERLSELSLNYCKLNPSSLKPLVKFKNLRDLGIYGSGLKARDLSALHTLTKIEKLNFDPMPGDAADEWLAVRLKLPFIRSIAESQSITRKQLTDISKSTKLQEVTLPGSFNELSKND
jgi:hypothetical protein